MWIEAGGALQINQKTLNQSRVHTGCQKTVADKIFRYLLGVQNCGQFLVTLINLDLFCHIKPFWAFQAILNHFWALCCFLRPGWVQERGKLREKDAKLEVAEELSRGNILPLDLVTKIPSDMEVAPPY